MKMLNIKTTILIVAVLLTAGIAFSQSSTDYKVIKNAIQKDIGKGGQSGTQVLYFLVLDKKSGKEEVRIQIPVPIIEWFIDCCKDSKIHYEGKKVIKVGELLEILRTSGNTSLIEINDYEEGRLFKAWIE